MNGNTAQDPTIQMDSVDELVRAACAGDETAFNTLARQYRRELHIHCYRMVASFDDAEDLVQETFLRAWQKRASFEGRSSYRTWLYRIATYATLDFIERAKRVLPLEAIGGANAGGRIPPPHVPWLQPYPDRLLEPAAPREHEPDRRVVAKEALSLAFLVAVQFLEARQRAVLILRDALGWTARETADLLDTTEAAVNGVLRRARATLRTQREALGDAIAAPRAPDEQEQDLIRRYVDAAERASVDGLAALLTADVRSSMPPQPESWVGRDDVVESWIEGGFGSPEFRDFRCLVTRANGMPAVACYYRAPGASEYLPLAMDVLHVRDGAIDEIVTFPFSDMLDAFGLPAALGEHPV